MERPPVIVVVTDASVLINLAHVARLDLLGSLGAFSFVVPEAVLAEILDGGQRMAVQDAHDRAQLRVMAMDGAEVLSVFTELRGKLALGMGESSCLALALVNGWVIASDDRRVARREIISRLGPGCLITTPDVFVMAIRAGVLTVAEADAAKVMLEEHRFRMRFRSFADLVGDHDGHAT